MVYNSFNFSSFIGLQQLHNLDEKIITGRQIYPEEIIMYIK